jgi:hypothetical protein
MKPRRTHNTNRILRLPGGTEDNDLWFYAQEDHDGAPVICSVWQPTDAEREAIANGENVRLLIWWNGHFPPVAMDITDEPLGKPPESDASV